MMTKMRYRSQIYGVLAIWLAGAAVVQGQEEMPQDHWAYYGKRLQQRDDFGRWTVSANENGIFAAAAIGGSDVPTQIERYDNSGAYVESLPIAFTHIRGLAHDSAGNLVVFDPPRVKVVSMAGSILNEWGALGDGPGEFGEIESSSYRDLLAVDSNDRVHVSDSSNYRVTVHTLSGEYLNEYGGQGSLPSQFMERPGGIRSLGDQIGVIVDDGIQLYDAASGDFVRMFGDTFEYPNAFAVAPDGVLMVSDRYNRVYSISHDATGVGTSVDYFQQIVGPKESNSRDRGATPVAFTPTGGAILHIWNRLGIGYPRIGGTYLLERRYRSTDNPVTSNALPQPNVSQVIQRPGTTEVEIRYTVVDTDDATVETRMIAIRDGVPTLLGLIPMRTFAGNTTGKLGPATATGVEHEVVWNAAADWSEDFGQIQVEALAKDNRNLLGVHWVTIPADGGEPELVISKREVSDWDLLSLAIWMVAGDDPRVVLEDGDLKAVGGPYAGQVVFPKDAGLVGGPVVSGSGRSFFIEEVLGLRQITAAEITRAQSGDFGLDGVSSHSVVPGP